GDEAQARSRGGAGHAGTIIGRGSARTQVGRAGFSQSQLGVMPYGKASLGARTSKGVSGPQIGLRSAGGVGTDTHGADQHGARMAKDASVGSAAARVGGNVSTPAAGAHQGKGGHDPGSRGVAADDARAACSGAGKGRQGARGDRRGRSDLPTSDERSR